MKEEYCEVSGVKLEPGKIMVCLTEDQYLELLQIKKECKELKNFKEKFNLYLFKMNGSINAAFDKMAQNEIEIHRWYSQKLGELLK